jgi:hypothetical protein
MAEEDRPDFRASRRRAKARTIRLLWCASASYVAVVALVLVAYGLPIDGWSWVCLLGGGLLIVPMAVPPFPKPAIALFVVYYLSFFFPWESSWLQDLRGGRRGIRIEPWGCAFGEAGPNTRLLEETLGPLEPEWRHQCIRSMLLGDWRDGNERVDSRSIIRYDYLPDILAMLPHDGARRQVLRCVPVQRTCSASTRACCSSV